MRNNWGEHRDCKFRVFLHFVTGKTKIYITKIRKNFESKPVAASVSDLDGNEAKEDHCKEEKTKRFV